MKHCRIYDCEWDEYHSGLIVDNKVYLLDKESKPQVTADLEWDAWENMIPLMQFYIGDPKTAENGGAEQVKWGFFNFRTGEIVVQPIYDRVYPFYRANLAKVILNKKTGFIDEQGNVVGRIVWDEACTFNVAALCAVRKNDLWGFAGRNGECVIEPQFESVGKWESISVDVEEAGLKEYAVWVKKNGKYGYLRDTGKYLAETIYEEARDFWAERYAPVKANGKWGFITAEGSFAIEPVFQDVGACEYDIYVVKQAGKWGALDLELELTMPLEDKRYVTCKGERIYLKNGQVSSRRKI